MEIKCPKCNEVFDLSEDIANRIREQVRTIELENEIKEQLAVMEERYKTQQKMKVNEAIIAERENSNKLLEAEKKKTEEIKNKLAELNAKSAKVEEQLAMAEKIHKAQLEKDVQEAHTYERERYEEKLRAAEEEAKNARFSLDLANKQHELDKQKAVNDTKDEYEKKLTVIDGEKRIIEAQYNQLKDFRSRQSTKMLGESLEQHCEIAFEQVRMMAFPKAVFGKDNQISKSGSKGDYIFKEYDENDIEIISIMFEMKNEMDTTSTKKKNKDFFKELDKDRHEKKCEYAVLVSRLEADSDIYNAGIVDVSYKYDKMYVIRPQFFIPLITMLRNAALRSHSAKQELERMKQQDVDLQNFEAEFNEFKDKFSNNYKDATNRFNDAIDEIDKTIDHLVKVKENLLKTNKHLSAANNNVDNVSVRKLTKNSPSIRAMLSEKNED